MTIGRAEPPLVKYRAYCDTAAELYCAVGVPSSFGKYVLNLDIRFEQRARISTVPLSPRRTFLLTIYIVGLPARFGR
jgi:hypothetical protein